MHCFASSDEKLFIDLGERSYEILVQGDSLSMLCDHPALPASGQALVVTNLTVGPLYSAQLIDALKHRYPVEEWSK